MSEKISPGTQLRYGVQVVCKTWGFARSSFYHKAQEKDRRGRRPRVGDEELLGEIRSTIEKNRFSGEGHRKVHARLKRKPGFIGGRNRVLRLMKENRLLSPYRAVQRARKEHDGRITTDRPNEMWGTDAAKIFTLEEGWVWFFGVLEHWNAECLGWHLTKQGDRFAAIEAMTQAMERVFGRAAKMAGQGVRLRVDHGSQFLSAGFINQVRYWGVSLSKGYVREPETNGVIERFHRTFKEQVVHGRGYRTLEDLKRATDDFIERYNAEWLLEKLAYHSPREARARYNNGMNVLKGMRRRPERAHIQLAERTQA